MKLVGSEQDILFLQDVHQLLLSNHKDDIEKLLSICGWKEIQIKIFLYLLKAICFEINEKELSLLYGIYDEKSGGAQSFGVYARSHFNKMSRRDEQFFLTRLI